MYKAVKSGNSELLRKMLAAGITPDAREEGPAGPAATGRCGGHGLRETGREGGREGGRGKETHPPRPLILNERALFLSHRLRKPNGRCPRRFRAPLHYAAIYGHVQMLQELLAACVPARPRPHRHTVCRLLLSPRAAVPAAERTRMF